MTAAAVTTERKSTRKSSLDLIRTLAILCVIINHAAEMTYPMHNVEAMNALSSASKIFGFSAFTLGRCGVPLFLFLSGYLLLSRAESFQSEGGIIRFYKKNLLPLLLTWEIWILLYNIFCAVLQIQEFRWKHYLAEALFLESAPLGHSWYLSMILGMYLFIPFLALVLSKMRGRWIFLLLGVAFVYSFIVPSLNLYFGNIRNLLDISFAGGTYGVYLVLGYCLFRYEARIKEIMKSPGRSVLAAVIAIVLFAATVAIQIWLFSRGQEYCVWYNFASMPLIGLALFVLLNKSHPEGFVKKIFGEISNCSFGMYLVHMPLMILLMKVFWTGHLSLTTVLDTIIIFIVSILVVTLIGRIPKVGKILFLRRQKIQ